VNEVTLKAGGKPPPFAGRGWDDGTCLATMMIHMGEWMSYFFALEGF